MLDDKKAIIPDVQPDGQIASHTADQQMRADESDGLGAKLQGKSRSDKQRQTSSTNGRMSHGPTSQAGKQKAAQNAVRDGIFSRRVVIEELGETREAFEQLRRAHFESLQPCGALEEQFVMDMTENWFLRERVRRGEELERRNRLNTFQLEYELRRSDQLDALRDSFFRQLESYLHSWDSSCRRLPQELDEVRRELMSMSEGIDFLLTLLEEIEAGFEKNGMLTAKHSALFQAVRGSGHPLDVRNRIEHLTTDNNSARPSTGAPESEPNCSRREQISQGSNDSPKSDNRLFNTSGGIVNAGVAAFISSVAESLEKRREKLKKIEAAEIQKEIALIMLDPSPSERFSRAETSRERKMYRALAGIFALRAKATSHPLSLPGMVNSVPQEFVSALESKIAKRARELPMSDPGMGTIEQTIVGDLPAPRPEVTSNGPPPS